MSSPAFHMMYSACKLNKQHDNIQPWHTPFPIWNQFVVPALVLTIASWPSFRFLSRQVRWSGIPISFKNFPEFVVVHTVKGFSLVNEAEVAVFLKFSCFFYDPTDVDNLTTCMISALMKKALNFYSIKISWDWETTFTQLLLLLYDYSCSILSLLLIFYHV